MREYCFIKKWEKLLTPTTVSLLTAIHEFKGEHSFFLETHADELIGLTEIAKLQSVESSNKMEGIFIPNDRLKKLAQDKTLPQNCNEQEIAGYRDVLNIINDNYDYIFVKSELIQQFHKDLYRYQGRNIGVRYKKAGNIISSVDIMRNKNISFNFVPSQEISESIAALCNAYNEALVDEKIDLLIVIPMFILDFLCIYPFTDGNGRISRLLTLLLLYKAGYIVGKYISIEKLIETTKAAYYEAILASSQSWNENENDYAPFVNYTLEIIAAAYKQFSANVRLFTKTGLTKGNRIEEIIKAAAGTITKSDIVKKCPDISQITVQRTLIDLQNAGKIKKIGGGRYTKYIWKLESEEN